MTVPKNRIVLGTTIAVIVAVLALFAQALIANRGSERDAARQRFADQASFSAGVIESTYGSSVPVVAKRNAELYGGPRPDQEALDLLIAPERVDYAYVLDANGHILASSGDMDKASVTGAAEAPGHIARVLGGQASWRISSLSAMGDVEYVTAFEGRDGRRALVQGWPAARISLFAGTTLEQLPESAGGSAYLTDGSGTVLASTDDAIGLGTAAPAVDPDRDDLTTEPVEGSDWKVVLRTTTATLYDGLSSLVSWTILIALAVAGVLGVWLLRRGMRQAEAVQTSSVELAAANDELQRTVTELARSNADLQQFAAVASHDLQEPLRKVQAFGDQLERRAGADLDERSQDYLHRMRNASARMSDLIEDLLRFSRVTTQARPPIPIDLAQIAEGVVSDLETRIDSAGGRVEIGALPEVLADPTQMRQLLQNLIANGLKFHAEDTAPVVRLEPCGPAPERMAAFTVSDNGIGVAPQYRERIFGIFERLHTRERYEGTGIGLALCQKIVERHDGTIAVDDAPGGGARFTITLPAATAAPAPPVPAVA